MVSGYPCIHGIPQAAEVEGGVRRDWISFVLPRAGIEPYGKPKNTERKGFPGTSDVRYIQITYEKG